MKLSPPFIPVVLLMVWLIACIPCFAKDADSTWDAIIGQANMLYRKGDFKEAVKTGELALKMSLDSYGSGHTKTATSFNNLGTAYLALGDFKNANRCAIRAIEIWDSLQDHFKIVVPLDLLALTQLKTGAYEEAEGTFQRILPIMGNALAPRDQATILDNVGQLYLAMGDFAKAEGFSRSAVDTYLNTVGPQHYETATAFNNRGAVFYSISDFDNAAGYFIKALDIRKNVLGFTHPDTAVSLSNLAEVYRLNRFYEQAEQLLLDAIKINEQTVGFLHSENLFPLNNLGLIYMDLHRPVEAHLQFERALTISDRTYGPDSPSSAGILYNLAILYMSQAGYDKAESSLTRALNIVNKLFGEKHIWTANVVNGLATVYALQGRYGDSLSYFQRGMAIQQEVIANVFGFGSEAQKFAIIHSLSKTYETLLSLIHQKLSAKQVAVKQAFNSVISRKGLVLDSQTQYEESLMKRLDKNGKRVWEELRRIRSMLARTQLHTGKQGDAYLDSEDIFMLEEKIRVLEKKLSSLNPDFQTDLIAPDFEAVVRSIPERNVLVEIVKIHDYDWKQAKVTSSSRYLAFVLRPDSEEKLRLIDLGDGETLESTVMECIADIRKEPWPNTLSSQLHAARRLYNVIWEPIEAFVKGTTTVIIGPDGVLNLVPFAALRTADEHFLIEDYSIVLVTTGRDLVKGGSSQIAHSDLFLAADPAFDWSPMPVHGNIQLNHPPLPSHHFPRLSGTAGAQGDIPPLIKGDNKITVVDKYATEKSVVRADRPRVMHLATHGFFKNDESVSAPSTLTDPSSFTGAEISTFPVPGGYENPLIRSGLAFAGANHAQNASDPDGWDGLLTAFEVSGMDLHGTDLVVLSACDTGVGEVRNGEGVYGLRRSFAIVGAKNLLMSLWPVWDKQVAKQMRTFYQLYGKEMPPGQALQESQLERIRWMRKNLNTEAPPSLWAPFVLQISRPSAISPIR